MHDLLAGIVVIKQALKLGIRLLVLERSVYRTICKYFKHYFNFMRITLSACNVIRINQVFTFDYFLYLG